jgi:hypothetical protein
MIDMVPTDEIYKRKILSPTDTDKIKTPDLSFLTEVIKGMEEELEAVTRKTIITKASTEQVSKKVKIELPILFSKTSSLDATIGKQVKVDTSELTAPTVWSSIALLTTLYYDIQLQVQDVPKFINIVTSEISKKMDQKGDSSNAETRTKLNELRTMLVSSLEQIGSRFHYESSKVDDIRLKMSVLEHQKMDQMGSRHSNGTMSQLKENADLELDVIQGALGEMKRKVDDLIADTHQDAIIFNGFGFRRFEEASSWLEIHSPDYKLGLIVDVNMVFEHLYLVAEKRLFWRYNNLRRLR